MPDKDYLGKDQRKTKDDTPKDDKPIKGLFMPIQAMCSGDDSLFMVCLALDEAEIALLKSYVSSKLF